MDAQSLELLRHSLDHWGVETLRPLAADLERYPISGRFPEGLFRSFDELGILGGFADPKSEIDLEALAEILFGVAGIDASIAVLLLGQNLSTGLLASAGRPAPADWLALPLYDHPLDWPRTDNGFLTCEWRSIPALPIAGHVLLPIVVGGVPSLVVMDLGERRSAGVGVSEPILTLGFRGCPIADLRLESVEIRREPVVLEGQALVHRLALLWSHAEVLAMAIRSAILHSAYRTALDYAGQRYQGGKVILEHSLIRRMLAEFQLADERLQTSWRRIARDAAPDRLLDRSAMAEALKSAVEAPAFASDGIQLLGGYGYMEDFGQEKRFRDVKQSEWLLGHPQVKRFAAFEQALEEDQR